MKNFLSKIGSGIAIFSLLGMNSVAFVEDDFPDFVDIEESIYKDAIEVLHDLEVLEGYENGEFRPKQKINRAEFVKVVLYLIDDDIENQTGGCFDDVDEEWFAKYVCRAKELGIVDGYPDGNFRPAQEVNMVEAMKMAMNAYGVEVEIASEGEAWYQPYVEFSHRNNIFSKYSYFASRSANREEVAFLVYKMLRYYNGTEEPQEVRVVNSPGCGVPKPDIAIDEFTVDGQQRSTITVVPDYYKNNEPIPLVVAFHGRTSPNWEVRGYYDLEGGEMGAIFVYPEAIKSGSSFSWSDSGDSAGELRDYEFFDEIVENIANNYCVDMDQIYVVGHSLGAHFTNSLACARGNIIRAVGSLGGSRSNSACTGPVAVMQWHNPNDRLASFSSGVTAKDQARAQNQCSDEYTSVEPSWGNCIEYKGCYEDAPVVWCPHNEDYSPWNGAYYPHNWPNGTGPSILEFFKSL